jgi:hypothetical protein
MPSILETQADTIVRRYTSMRIASLRMSWVVPDRSVTSSLRDRSDDLWGYTQRDSAAHAVLLAILPPSSLPASEAHPKGWTTGHEVFFLVSPKSSEDKTFETLRHRAYPDVLVKEGGPWTGFFDCSKAERILGWKHQD